MKYFPAHTIAGYSLVEVLVAISILLIVVTGPLTILTTTARSTNFASEQVTAFFLAQEGLELIQKRRDDFFLDHFDGGTADPWVDFVTSVTTNIGGTNRDCTTWCNAFVANGGTVTLFNGLNQDRMMYNGNNLLRSRIIYDGGAAGLIPMSPEYRRRITVTDDGIGLRVRSEVTWVTGSIAATQRVVLDTYLYNSYNI